MEKYVAIMILILISLNFAKKITILRTEHPTVTYYDKSVFKYVNLNCSRHSRANPIYYCNVDVHTLVPYDSNMIVDFVHYERIGEALKLSFIRFQYRGCEMFDSPFVTILKTKLKSLNVTCPIPPGRYLFTNLTATFEAIPVTAPHTKGRCYMNITSKKTKKTILASYLDLELLQVSVFQKH